MNFNSRMLCTCILDHMLYTETTSQVLVVRHSMVYVDSSRGGNYNVVTTSRLFFTQLSNILFQVVSEWQTQTCTTWVITWSMEATNEFSPDPLTLWLYFAPWTVWIYVFGTLNKVLHSQTNSEIKDLYRLLVLCQRATRKCEVDCSNQGWCTWQSRCVLAPKSSMKCFEWNLL